MTSIVLSCDKNGSFCSCSAKGHADFAVRGNDIVCSAVSILLRTTMQVLSNNGIELQTDTSKRGELFFSCTSYNSPKICEALFFARQFLEAGFTSLAKEFPSNVTFQINVK